MSHGQDERYGEQAFPNGDIYIGYFDGLLPHGHGKYTWSDGATYEGEWENGKIAGKGWIFWPSGSIYEGEFSGGFLHGCGTFSSIDGSVYKGSWRLNTQHGQGTKSYPNSDIYEGLWREGQQEGIGKYTWCNGNMYVGNWKAGRMSGRGVLKWANGDLFNGHWLDGLEHGTGYYYFADGSCYLGTWSKGLKDGRGTYYPTGSRLPFQQKCYRYTVGKITPVPVREVRSSDFGPCARIKMYFPRKGSQFTPPHYSIDFHWKDYCPMVFRNLREMFKIDAADYMVSVCGGDGLKELSSPGKSGSIFYLSQDERFVIKTLRKTELKVLLKMLPNYYDHVGAHDNTLITKFFGLHRITIKCGQKVRFVVMGNMFCTELRIHRRYDLKGSSHGRSTSADKINENTTLKDLDLSYVFHLEKSWRESLFKQISLDCMFLESQCIIDYSMLLGLHFRAPECLRPPLESESRNEYTSSAIDNVGAPKQDEFIIPPKGLLLVAHEPGSVSSMPGSHIRGSTLRASAAGDKEREVDLLLPGTGRLRVQLGVNMPAQANQKLLHNEGPDSPEVDLFEVYDVVLYLGIIDILQEYDITKKVEHTCKSLKHDPLAISAVEPKLYSRRFISFLEKVFPEQI